MTEQGVLRLVPPSKPPYHELAEGAQASVALGQGGSQGAHVIHPARSCLPGLAQDQALDLSKPGTGLGCLNGHMS